MARQEKEISAKGDNVRNPTMSMLLSTLAKRLNLVLQGEDAEFTGLNTLEDASATEVSFLANPKYAHFLSETKACAVILTKDAASLVRRALISDNPYRDFAVAASFFERPQGEFSGISDTAVVHPTARIGENCAVYPFAFVGPRARIGNGCVLFPGAYVGEDCVLGNNCRLLPGAVALARVMLEDNCTLHSGAVVGTDGFGFVRMDGAMRRIPQIGTARLAEGVDLGANTCVDRAALGVTHIGKDSKLDNLVQIGHNVRLGEQCLIISQVGVAGSTKVGDRVTMAGQAGIAGHLTIGSDVTIGPQAGVPKDLPDGTVGSGSPFMESRTFMRAAVVAPKLPDMYRRLQELEKELAEIKKSLAGLAAEAENQRSGSADR